MSIFAGLAIYEFNKLTTKGKINQVALVVDIVVAALIIWADFSVYIFYLIPRLIYAVFDKREDALHTTIYSIFAIFYIAIPLYCVSDLDQSIALLMFIMIWLNDTGAYCVGSLFGKHRLCERLSPKKSLEGFFGGMAFCIAAGAVAGCITTDTISVGGGISMGIVVCILATLGDLFESLIKRTLHVKDSGNLIPGHGGILDRIDSLLFVAPVIFFNDMPLYLILLLGSR
jgi:phosphatidate cytidylyltransferase